MSWNPDEYPSDESALNADSVLNSVESEHKQVVEHEQQVVETLSEAMKRIEEANLWKTLLTLDVFQPGSARGEIVNSVNAKVKKFALNNLELCVGIKTEQEKKLEVPVKIPFDNDEVTALKVLAAKVLKRDISTAITPQTYKPQVMQVSASSSPANNLNMVKVPGNTNKAQKTQSQPAKKPAAKNKRPGYIQPSGTAGSGYVPPTQNSATASSDGTAGAGLNLQNLVSSLIQNASGGNVLAQNSNPVSDVDDINERF